MPESWVINASPVILLAKAGLISHVPLLAKTFVIPEPVVTEILGVRREDAAAKWLADTGKQFVRPAVAELPALGISEIGRGERSVISWAATYPGFVAVLDDYEARVIAQRHGIKILGSVGIILRLKKAGLISEVKTHLLEVKKVGGFIGDELFREALRRAGETL